ncbi:MAG: hypothetical protein H7Y32_04855, partial [Chloroflexales bacterium]|nr:hypothetical protein [Chloroflexales bacterium]
MSNAEAATPVPDSADQLRDALQHLYQPDVLAQHPLADLLVLPAAPGRGQLLQTCLTTAIAKLQPGIDVPVQTSAWRDYQLLCWRYIEAQSSSEVAQRLGLSERQLRREQNRALARLAESVRVTMAEAEASAHDAPAWADALEAEMVRIGAAPTDVAVLIAPLVERVHHLVAELATRCGAVLDVAVRHDLPPVRVNDAALRQMLLSLLSCAIAHCPRVAVDAQHVDGAVRLLVRG